MQWCGTWAKVEGRWVGRPGSSEMKDEEDEMKQRRVILRNMCHAQLLWSYLPAMLAVLTVDRVRSAEGQSRNAEKKVI